MVPAMRLAALIAIGAAGAAACVVAAPPPPTATPGVPVDRNVMGRANAPVVVEEWADFF
ncbi:MAG: hypothetical protein HYU88_10085 [Chloroflexi bacterium]|nr:hypothetical protein [Chloroflexota bacterium]